MKFFSTYNAQILETIVLIALLLVINFIFRKWSGAIAKKFHLGILRRNITIKVVNFILILVAIILITGIWGLDQEQLFIFFTSAITVLGIGFFASWSILSNITSGILLFFNHPMHIGDHIKILDKEMPVEGTLKDISMFFMHIQTADGQMITIPNIVVTQKIVSTSQQRPGHLPIVDIAKEKRGSDIEDAI